MHEIAILRIQHWLCKTYLQILTSVSRAFGTAFTSTNVTHQERRHILYLFYVFCEAEKPFHACQLMWLKSLDHALLFGFIARFATNKPPWFYLEGATVFLISCIVIFIWPITRAFTSSPVSALITRIPYAGSVMNSQFLTESSSYLGISLLCPFVQDASCKLYISNGPRYSCCSLPTGKKRKKSLPTPRKCVIPLQTSQTKYPAQWRAKPGLWEELGQLWTPRDPFSTSSTQV